MDFQIRKTIFTTVLLYAVVLSFFVEIGSEAQDLPSKEVQALEGIADKLQIPEWKVISANACNNGDLNKNRTEDMIIFAICNCSLGNDTLCHITNIFLKELSLNGEIPDEFGNLTYLQEIDLTRNYLNGTIPTSLTKLSLVSLQLLGNRLSGSIPKELGSISTLEAINLEDNLLEGSLPESLGNLSRLRRLLLSANNFTGQIPESFGKLKNLTDFRVDGNTFSGKLPSFIGNWTKLDRLDMQGTSMEGPIPSTISLLESLTELRITDLNGSSSTFPDFSRTLSLEQLVLRNCLINGSIPDYIGDMPSLKTWDLSFNQLSGVIPTTIDNLDKLVYVFLSNNSLTGSVPDKLSNPSDKMKIDLSYNNFTETPVSSCLQTTVNLASNYASTNNSVNWCLKKGLPCSQKPKYHSLFINCGGQKMTYDNNDYSEDTSGNGASYFFSDSERWGFSSNGVFIGDDGASNIATNAYSLNITGPDYYQNARLAAISLRYYGFCMLEGNYTVKLHFAEIMYTDDQTYKSLGRRLFDVSIQGKRYIKDFNIEKEAGGVGKSITKEYNVYVNESTLEIHLYWAGKGTTAIPERGVYGPLISAITVTPNFKVPSEGGGLSGGAIAGIVIASFVVVALILLFLRMKGYLGGNDVQNIELMDLKTGYFSLKQIKAATNNFDPANKIGEGGFGPVYKGLLSDGGLVAVKQLSSKSKQGNREFLNEIGMISAVQHPNLVKLYGCCIEGNQLLLIYEYLENNSLARALFGRDEQRLNLDWKTRKNICLDIARGLAYLHEESRLKIVHRDIKTTNVLLDKALNAKISDFGLAKLDEEDDTHISTRIAGTYGYMAPEYAMRGYLTDKADVYSFGVVVLEIVSGKSNTNYRPKEEFVYLLDWAYVLQEQGNILELVDPVLGKKFSKEEALRLLNISLLCTNPSPTLRPQMTSVVSMIDGHMPIQAPLVQRKIGETKEGSNAMFKSLEMISHDSSSQSQVSTYSNDSEVRRSMFTDGPWRSSSTSVRDSSTAKLVEDSHDVDLY